MTRLARRLHTPRARALVEAEPLFAASLADARERIAATSEARALGEVDGIPPLGGLRELDELLARLRRGGSATGEELLALAVCARTSAETARLLARRAELAPKLAETAAGLLDCAPLAAAIEAALDPAGEVRDSASPALAAARREAREAAASAQQRIARMASDPALAGALQDDFYTVRNDRYVLPVRSEARGRVPGIVHDASASGTTVFIEPQAIVELNNRLKQAEITIEHEVRRVLQALSERASAAAPALDCNLDLLAQLDLAFARAALAREMDAAEPTLDDGGVFRLDQLRHPLLPANVAVPNDLRLGESFHVLVISGPNAGGKTVAAKSLALATLFTWCGLHVPASRGARVGAMQRVLADIGDEQDLRESLSTFSAHMANLAEVVACADARTLVVLDEVGSGTDPGEGAAIAQAVLETLADQGARVVATTHFNLLKEMAEVDARFENASVDFHPETLAPTYRLRFGAAGSSSATAVAARMGVPQLVLDRANSLLDREDRRLDRMLSELAASRASLERERQEAERLREESDATRAIYRERLERLQERRDRLFAEMRSDLDGAFRSAHAEVAAVIRDLQRHGRSSESAAHARARLLALERKADAAETEQRVKEPEPAPAAPRAGGAAIDWRRIAAGARVQVIGGHSGRLIALPDRKGRATVQIANAKLQIAADRLVAVSEAETPAPEPRVRFDAAPAGARNAHADLRGMRVDEALAALEKALDDAARCGSERLEIVHGIGTGALQSAVREHLRRLPFVARFEPGAIEAGGEGVTIAFLA